MKRVITGLIFILALNGAHAQLSITAGYGYLNAEGLDNVVRTYNFARPWLEEKQPLITHIPSISVGWYSKKSDRRSVFITPQLSYGRLINSATNNNIKRSILMNEYTALVDIKFNPRALFQDVSAGPIGARFFMHAGLGSTVWNTRVAENEEALAPYDELYSPWSITFFANMGIGYHWLFTKKYWVITPIISARFYPYIEIDDFSWAVQGPNATYLSNRSMNNWMFWGGLEFTKLFENNVKKNLRGKL